MDDLKGLEDILRVARNAGAKRILLPFSTIRDMQDIPLPLLASGLMSSFCHRTMSRLDISAIRFFPKKGKSFVLMTYSFWARCAL